MGPAARWAIALPVVVLLVGPPAPLAAQADKPPPAAGATNDAGLARIRSALETDATTPPLDLDMLRFYLQINVVRPTFADYLRGSGDWFQITGTTPPSASTGSARLPDGSGINLASLFGKVERALHNRKVRNINEQIDEELRRLESKKAGNTPPAPE